MQVPVYQFATMLAIIFRTLVKERIRKIPSHLVAALSALGIEQGNPFRDCIDSLLIGEIVPFDGKQDY